MKQTTLSLFLLSIGILIGFSACDRNQEKVSSPDPHTAFDQMREKRTLKIGWGGFPPYTQAVPGKNEPEGFMVDLVNEIAKRCNPPINLEWHLLTWDTFRADLQGKRFDVIVDPVYITIDRLVDFTFTDPIGYFGLAVGLVRIDETRFKEFSDLDQTNVIVALAEGYTSTEYARKNLTKAQLKGIPIGQDAIPQLDEVLFSRADVALNDTPTILQYVRAHPKQVKALWLDRPPSLVAGAFISRKSEGELIAFLNQSIGVLRTDGTLHKLDIKWKTLGLLPEVQVKPGSGLTE
jgi:ABC-type amino acid transport substrate-binding protein